MPVNLSYPWFKLSAIAWLVIGRPKQAETVFDEMLRRWPGDAVEPLPCARASRPA
jgi:hypothetical protein